VQPYWGKLVRIEGETAYVKKDETKRLCAVPLWSLRKTTQWEMTPININARPSFRRLSSKSKAKICAGADAALRGKLFECETKMRRMEAQYKRNMQREAARSARAIRKMHVKCAVDVQAAEVA